MSITNKIREWLLRKTGIKNVVKEYRQLDGKKYLYQELIYENGVLRFEHIYNINGEIKLFRYFRDVWELK